MIKFERPDEPDGFAAKASIALQDVQSRIDLTTGKIADGATLTGKDFSGIWRDQFQTQTASDQLWRAVKDALSNAQNGRCAYCEREVTGAGAIEHIHPKTIVTRLVSRGEEQSNRFPKGRTRSTEVRPGYWWRAFDWKNFCFSCGQCNHWKMNDLVVDPPHSFGDPPAATRTENVHFINPYETDPEFHLKVEETTGAILSVTALGGHTIDILGFKERESLFQGRFRAFDQAMMVAKASELGPDPPSDALLDELHHGRDFALARRCAIRTFVGDENYELLKKLANPPSAPSGS